MSTTAPKHPASPNVDEPVAKTARTEKEGAAEEVKMEEETAAGTAAAAKGAPSTTAAEAAGTSAAQPIDVEMEEARSMEKARPQQVAEERAESWPRGGKGAAPSADLRLSLSSSLFLSFFLCL